MRDAVGVAVALQSEWGIEPDSREDQGAARRCPVNVIAMAYTKGHGQVLRPQSGGANRNSRWSRSRGEVSLRFGRGFSRRATGWPRCSTAAASSVTLRRRAATLEYARTIR